MLQIHHADDAATDPRSPSKLYADACWAANPRLSPDWWREAQGHTFGKLALDWRTAISQPEHLLTGCNLILASPATWPAVTATLAASPAAEAFVTILVTPDATTIPTPAPTFLLWQPAASTTPQQRQTALIQLETHVRNGTVEAYGLALDDLATHPLHHWLEDAAEAANTVWSRRKRPALRLLLTPMDMLDLTLLTAPLAKHKAEAVSTLELAARLDLTTIITAPALPTDADLPPEALAALTQAAGAEHHLNQILGGWPQLHGQPLFSLLSPLSQGYTPWATPGHAHAWQTRLWPQLRQQWQALATPVTQPNITEYLNQLEKLQIYIPALALAAVQPLLQHALQRLAGHFPPLWLETDDFTRNLAFLTSIPGVTALALASPFQPLSLQQRPNLPDIGAFWQS